MRSPGLLVLLCVTAALGSVTSARAQEASAVPQPDAQSAPLGAEPKDALPKSQPRRDKPEVATFGGGCFWCTEAVCQRVPGVISVVSGYSGGAMAFPSYEQVCSGTTGHAECVQVVFDPNVLPYEKLLEVFWRSHDPTTRNAQGPDFGTQYRSVIFYHNKEQKAVAEETYKTLKAKHIFRGAVVTELVPFRAFFPAEAYHQNYYNNHPSDPYSLVYIEPKFDVFRKMMKGAKPAGKAAHRPSAKLQHGAAAGPSAKEKKTETQPTDGPRPEPSPPNDPPQSQPPNDPQK